LNQEVVQLRLERIHHFLPPENTSVPFGAKVSGNVQDLQG
jgi:hypothetical protein